MRRNLTWAITTLAGLVLLLSYRTSLAGPDAASADGGSAASGVAEANVRGAGPTASAPDPTTSSGSPSGGPAGGSAGAGGSGSTSGVSGTYTGSVVQTRWGPVQVRIVVAEGRITEATAVRYPSANRHDQRINAEALPELNAQAVARQSADLDSISGATVTSSGYMTSLQAAIDKANL